MDEERRIGHGTVALHYDDWHAVLAALEGDTSQQDDAFDALQRWAPRTWLDAFDSPESNTSGQQSPATPGPADTSIQ